MTSRGQPLEAGWRPWRFRTARRSFGLALLLGLFVAFSLIGPPAHAVEPDEVLQDPALETRARALSAELRCLVCQNQSIDDSNASLAKDLRVLVRERLVAGDSDRAVLDYLVARYGEFVLLKPRFGVHTLLLWAIGPLLLIIGLGSIYFVRKSRARSAIAAEALTPEEKLALDKLLQE